MTAYDVVVVGVGPGGAAAAGHLARMGFKVLAVDRSQFPRDKVCSDALTGLAQHHLEQMGLDVAQSGSTIKGIRLFRGTENGRFDNRYFPFPNANVRMVRRFVLDAKLREWAQTQGAEVREQVRFSSLIHCPGGGFTVSFADVESGVNHQVQARFVIGADGANSIVRRQIGFIPTGKYVPGTGMRTYVRSIRQLEPVVELYLHPMSRSGPVASWVFPMGDDWANVGVSIYRTRPDQPITNPAQVLESHLARLMKEDPRFIEAQDENLMKGQPLAVRLNPDEMGVPGVLLVGDAAGLANPFLGGGIGYALEMGTQAAESIKRHWTNPEAVLLDYQSRIKHVTRSSLTLTWENAPALETGIRLLQEAVTSDRKTLRSYLKILFDYVAGDPTGRTRPLGEEDGPEAVAQQVRNRIRELAKPYVPYADRLWDGLIDDRELIIRANMLWLYGPRKPGVWEIDLLATLELTRLALVCHDDAQLKGSGGRLEAAFPLLLGDWALAEGYHLTGRLSSDVAVRLASVLESILQAKAAWHTSGHTPSQEDDLRGWFKRQLSQIVALAAEELARHEGRTPQELQAAWRFGEEVGIAVAALSGCEQQQQDGTVASQAYTATLERAAERALTLLPLAGMQLNECTPDLARLLQASAAVAHVSGGDGSD